MKEFDVKIACLKLAAELGGSEDDIIERAKKFLEFMLQKVEGVCFL